MDSRTSDIGNFEKGTAYHRKDAVSPDIARLSKAKTAYPLSDRAMLCDSLHQRRHKDAV